MADGTLVRTGARISTVIDAVCNAGRWIAAWLIGAMTLIVLTHVFFRYVLNDSLNWSEETSILMMVWVAFLCAPWAYRYGANVAILSLQERLPPRLMLLMRLILNVIVMGVLVIFFYYAVLLVDGGFKIFANTLPVRMAWFYMIVPASFGMMIVVGVELMVRDAIMMFDPRKDLIIRNPEILIEGE